ncbi:hypothetical protein ACS78_08085 [Priestia megaterium]|uniref:hypothetical protein n=1 Tax=Priestia megaterium TaxID=1404 RepID=UPI0006836773|nr:hypothetical protein [Priestia megaterium]KNH23902.1 hypothetical protein ACS78_08085 [Priestia megaterium]
MIDHTLKPGELLEVKVVGLHVICKFMSYCKRPRHIHVEAIRVITGEVVEGSEACIPITKYMSRYELPSDAEVILPSEEQELVNKLIEDLEKQLFDYHINKALDTRDEDKFFELVRGMKGEVQGSTS